MATTAPHGTAVTSRRTSGASSDGTAGTHSATDSARGTPRQRTGRRRPPRAASGSRPRRQPAEAAPTPAPGGGAAALGATSAATANVSPRTGITSAQGAHPLGMQRRRSSRRSESIASADTTASGGSKSTASSGVVPPQAPSAPASIASAGAGAGTGTNSARTPPSKRTSSRESAAAATGLAPVASPPSLPQAKRPVSEAARPASTGTLKADTNTNVAAGATGGTVQKPPRVPALSINTQRPLAARARVAPSPAGTALQRHTSAASARSALDTPVSAAGSVGGSSIGTPSGTRRGRFGAQTTAADMFSEEATSEFMNCKAAEDRAE